MPKGGKIVRIALIVPFAKGSVSYLEDAYFKRYITKPEEVTVFWTGTIYPGETPSDVMDDLPNTINAIKAAERDGFDAVVLAPHFDTALEEGRELVSIPVLAPTRVAIHVGGILGHQMCIIAPNEPSRRAKQFKVRAYGLESMVTVRAMGMSHKEFRPYYTEYQKSGTYGDILDRLVTVAIKGIEEDDATVLVGGAGCLIWLVDAAEKKLKEKGYDVPFINPLPMAVDMARALVSQGLTHSRLAYPGFKWETGDAHWTPPDSKSG